MLCVLRLLKQLARAKSSCVGNLSTQDAAVPGLMRYWLSKTLFFVGLSHYFPSYC